MLKPPVNRPNRMPRVRVQLLVIAFVVIVVGAGFAVYYFANYAQTQGQLNTAIPQVNYLNSTINQVKATTPVTSMTVTYASSVPIFTVSNNAVNYTFGNVAISNFNVPYYPSYMYITFSVINVTHTGTAKVTFGNGYSAPSSSSSTLVQYLLGSNQTLQLDGNSYTIVSYDLTEQTITLTPVLTLPITSTIPTVSTTYRYDEGVDASGYLFSGFSNGFADFTPLYNQSSYMYAVQFPGQVINIVRGITVIDAPIGIPSITVTNAIQGELITFTLQVNVTAVWTDMNLIVAQGSTVGTAVLQVTNGGSSAPPVTFSSITSSNPYADQPVTLSADLQSQYGVTQYYYTWNNTGVWADTPTENFTGNPASYMGTWNVNASTVSVYLNAQDIFGTWWRSPTTNFSITPLITYNITATSDANSIISPRGIVVANEGSNITFTYSTVNTGYVISTVTVDNTSVPITGNYTFVNIQADHTITVTSTIAPTPTPTPTPVTYTITASSDVHSTITPNGSVQVTAGTGQTFVYSANTGYTISSVIVNSVSVPITGTYTFNDVNSNQNISISSTPVGGGT